ncbi:uncharacterized protein LOC123659891 [Melitaea cinxia]|uniref:uncharacterized protein LOC123659891 n=1 Tax=Melitaea cinxia TaxID=113334 RepID=UPI001E26F11D|nr:uncharacterized protein LOC123659891 [Melitaea cinxia]
MIKTDTSRTLFNKSSEKPKQNLLSPLGTKMKYKRNISDVSVENYDPLREVFLPVRNLKNAENLLSFKLYSKKQNKIQFRHRLATNIYKKYKIISADLRNRLHVEDPRNDLITVNDIDEDFYRSVDGRPVRLHIPVFKSLKESLNKLLHIKQEIGIKKDCFLQSDTNYRNEMRVFELAVRRLTDHVKSFDKFISENHHKSMTILTKSDKLKNQVELQVQELQNVAIEKFTIISKLIGLEYKYGLQQKYGRFLYYLSPPSWRLSNRDFARSCEIEAKGFDFINSSEDDNFAVIFERLQQICYGVPIKPALYFTRPKDLMDVFDAMETQQLHYYTHVHHLSPYIKILKDGILSLQDIIIQDSAYVASSIKRFEDVLLFSEQKCAHLEARFFKILYGLFYKCVAATDVLKLTIHLQFCYERVLLEKPLNMDLRTIARSLEFFYMDISKKLDSIKSEAVRRAVIKCMDTEKLKIRRANNAATELRLFHRLEQELLRSYGFCTANTYKPIKYKTSKNSNKSQRIENNMKEQKKKSLTEAELEYLTLFTDWTENDNPAVFLESLNLNDKNSKNEFVAT